jgi:hypothetical protein
MRCLLVVAVVLSLAAVAVGLGGARELERLEIPTGRPVTVDGVLLAGEWDDAATVEIAVSSGWVVRVLVKHDASNLYFAFTHLRHSGAERYPEVLLDPATVGGNAWRPGQLWFHSSYNLCEGDGAFNLYRRGGVFLCAKTKSGWEANHAPRRRRDGDTDCSRAARAAAARGQGFRTGARCHRHPDILGFLASGRRACTALFMGQGDPRRRPAKLSGYFSSLLGETRLPDR